MVYIINDNYTIRTTILRGWLIIYESNTYGYDIFMFYSTNVLRHLGFNIYQKYSKYYCP